MRPTFQTLKSNHYSSEPSHKSYKSAKDVYTEIGYSLEELMAVNVAYANTCAVRMSLALLKSGVPFTGRLTVKEGKFKGKKFEPGAKLLADQLKRPSVLGSMEEMDPAEAKASLLNKKGLIFFWKLTEHNADHIDLIETSNNVQLCNSHCYFDCKKVWFWELI